MQKYLTESEINNILGHIEIPETFRLMSQDSYNETLIATAIKATGHESELLQATLNLAIVGFGNKNYGFFHTGDQIINISSLFKQCGVKTNNGPNSLLKEDEITPNRLCRFFRYHIRSYIKKNKIGTYLYRKYSNHDPNFADICFRGAEYLDELTLEEQNYLLQTVAIMDQRIGTRIQDRIQRVLAAKKGIQLSLMPSTPIMPNTTTTTSTSQQVKKM
jgi:hypothetical protein